MIETQARSIADFNSALVDLVALYAVLHLPLLGEALIYYVQHEQDFLLLLPLSPIFLRPKEEAYLEVTEDDRYYLVLTEEELALCHGANVSVEVCGIFQWP